MRLAWRVVQLIPEFSKLLDPGIDRASRSLTGSNGRLSGGYAYAKTTVRFPTFQPSSASALPH